MFPVEICLTFQEINNHMINRILNTFEIDFHLCVVVFFRLKGKIVKLKIIKFLAYW